jgi:nucleoside-triphosphatase
MHTVRHVLLTGEPGVGKTTAFLAAVDELRRRQASKSGAFASVSGFATHEVRGGGDAGNQQHGGGRTGFKVETIPEGQSAALATRADLCVGERGPTVGRYTVHVSAIDNVAIPAMLAYRTSLRTTDAAVAAPHLVTVDEIGKMECLSPTFCRAVTDVVSDPKACLLATVALKGGGLVASIKQRTDVRVISVTHSNRNEVVDQIVHACVQASSGTMQ